MGLCNQVFTGNRFGGDTANGRDLTTETWLPWWFPLGVQGWLWFLACLCFFEPFFTVESKWTQCTWKRQASIANIWTSWSLPKWSNLKCVDKVFQCNSSEMYDVSTYYTSHHGQLIWLVKSSLHENLNEENLGLRQYEYMKIKPQAGKCLHVTAALGTEVIHKLANQNTSLGRYYG